MPDRSKELSQWLDQLGHRDYQLARASEDASFRSYLRLQAGGQSWVVMDAPPEQEPCDQFIEIAGMLRAAGLNAPEIIASNLETGFLLLTDFGSRDYLSVLDSESVGRLYADAMDALLKMQTGVDASDLPVYDSELLLREIDLFHDWFLGELLGIELDSGQQSTWLEARQQLVDNALEQPRVFVHRDYHSRNLMVLEQGNPGILDFQDAVHGPVTYDLVSLLRDCYIDWPPARVEEYVLNYLSRLRAAGLTDAGSGLFMRWFNLMGMQRHLKAVGIFSRLKIRDGKSRYLDDIPRTLGYLERAAADESSMSALGSLLADLAVKERIEALLGGADK